MNQNGNMAAVFGNTAAFKFPVFLAKDRIPVGQHELFELFSKYFHRKAAKDAKMFFLFYAVDPPKIFNLQSSIPAPHGSLLEYFGPDKICVALPRKISAASPSVSERVG